MSSENPVWKADLGDGTYQNPILYADYSDPDVVRVGEDYFMVASSFCNTPALPLLHSKDLVNWKVVNYVLDKIPYPDYDKPKHGCGVWAPSIRYHDGKFWVFYPMPDEGIFACTAEDPFGKWSAPIPVRLGSGWIDPCPLWDDDGKAYLVSGFAKSRIGFKSILNLAEMKPDATGLIDDGKHIFDGHNTQPTIEGPKLYKHDGMYYILAPAGGVPHGWQTALRAKNIWGPYEEKIVMMRGDSDVNGPHQGALVDTPSGETWFLHFQDVGACGRIVHLQPVEWVDGWPIIGCDAGKEGYGCPVAFHKKPDVGAEYPVVVPDDSDEFDGASLGLQWQWNANYQSKWYSLSESCLTLYAQKYNGGLCDLPSLLLQKFPAPAFEATAAMDISGLACGEMAGLMVMGGVHAALAVKKEESGISLLLISGNEKDPQEKCRTISSAKIDGELFFRLRVTEGKQCEFSYSIDNHAFLPAAEPFETCKGRWVGAKMGLFCISPKEGEGFLRSDFFRVEPLS